VNLGFESRGAQPPGDEAGDGRLPRAAPYKVWIRRIYRDQVRDQRGQFICEIAMLSVSPVTSVP
jgi:hypothetical protein